MAVILLAAGYTKFFVWGLDKVTASMAQYGLPAPALFAWLAAVGELFGGAALLVGLMGRWLGLFYVAQFAVAFFAVKLPGAGFTAGWLDLMLLAGSLMLFLAGPGRAAFDNLWLERDIAPPPIVQARDRTAA